MKHSRILIVAATAGILGGCAGQQPTTAEEYRKGVRNAGPMVPAKLETFTVSRPFSDVAAILKRNHKKCLAVTIRTTTRQGYSVRVTDTTYNPHLRVRGNRAELSIRMIQKGGGIQIQTPPAGGYFMMVVDATRVGPNKTRIDMYRPTIGHSAMIDGIRSWTKGRSRGCPDLTKSGL